MSLPIKVAVRLKGVTEPESIKLWETDGPHSIVFLGLPRQDRFKAVSPTHNVHFHYDHCLGGDSSNPVQDQEHLYKVLVSEYVDDALHGYNACILAYGQTGAGKTYMMLGQGPGNPGIIPRFCGELIGRLHGRTHEMHCTFYEIYNEEIYDLLHDEPRHRCKIREDSYGTTFVEGIQRVKVQTVAEILKLLARGAKLRTTESTNTNTASSRSHALFQIHMNLQDTTTTTPASSLQCQISFVDMAGSERAVATNGLSKARIKEGSQINKSLSNLGRVLSTLAKNCNKSDAKLVPPYRDSALTWALKNNLSGNSKTCFIACACPENYSETLSTLRYASIAAQVLTNSKANKHVSTVNRIQFLEDQVRRLQKELQARIDTEHATRSLLLISLTGKENQVQSTLSTTTNKSQLKGPNILWIMDRLVGHQRAIDQCRVAQADISKSKIQFSAKLQDDIANVKSLLTFYQARQ